MRQIYAEIRTTDKKLKIDAYGDLKQAHIMYIFGLNLDTKI